ncbi:MAG: OmpA family protein [Salinivirgaceae bacterium]|jgi:outer membrane protein OmpA-like peptidoglycan-associated protein/type II secretory pathway pseudopilin PulG
MAKLQLGILLFFTLLNFQPAQGQQKYATQSKKAIQFYEEAIQWYQQMNYDEAIKSLNHAIEKDVLFVDAYLLKAEVYRSQELTELEIENYLKAIEIDPNYFEFVFFNLGSAYYNIGEYKQSEIQLLKFISIYQGKPITLAKANNLLKKCEYAQNLVDNPVPFTPINLGPAVNDSLDQYWPSLSVDGKTLVYTVMLVDSSRKTIFGNYAHQEDFYISRFVDGEWKKGQPIGSPINTSANEGAQQISADGKTLVFTGCNRSDGFGNCDIYFSFLQNNEWTVPVNGGPLLNSSFSEKQPSLSADGRVLYFASDRPGGIGEMDIWYSMLSVDGYWLRPKNMGRVINTVYEEASPYIHSDNRSFYFSSDGHPNLGNKDIFYSHRNDSNQWTKPQNIGYPINSFRDEIGLVINNSGNKAYYSSDINNSWDIYQFELPVAVKPNPVAYVSGIVTDADTHQKLSALIQLLGLTSLDTLALLHADQNDGSFLICLPAGASYALNVSHPGYLYKSINFNLDSINTFNEPLLLNIELNKIKEGKSVVLENIFFEKDSFNLLSQSYTELQKLIDFITNNPNLVFEIGGHTDDSGTQEYNQQLSEKRAKEVFDFIIKTLAIDDNIAYKGYGETQPMMPNDSNANRAKNRRTELKVLKIK